MDPGDADREELESRVAELEETVRKMLPDRRGVLKGLGAAAVGGAVVGASSGGASGQSGAGQVGTENAPVDVEGAQGNFDSVSTESLNSDVWVEESVADALSQLGTKTINGFTMAAGKIKVPPEDYNEIIEISTPHTRIEGQGVTSSRFYSSADDHIITISQNDVELDNIWVDHSGTGSYDAIYATERETRLEQVSVDAAPRYAIHLGGARCHLSDFEAEDGGSAAVYVGGGDTVVSDGILQSPPADGIVIDSNRNSVDNVRVISPGGDGIVIDDTEYINYVQGIVDDAGDVGVRVDGNSNVLNVSVNTSTNEDLVISGNQNAVYGFVEGDVLLESEAENNDLTNAIIDGNVSDNSGNSTNDY